MFHEDFEYEEFESFIEFCSDYFKWDYESENYKSKKD